MPTTTALRLACMLGAAAWALVLARAPAAAQGVCVEDDAGVCEEDAGVDEPMPDAGADAGIDAGGPDAGFPARDAGGGGEGVACSCHTDSEAERGARIHVCTESFDRDVCRDFDCERGTVRSRGCSSAGVVLCCEMRSRGLQTSLYDDCTHPNCESGFREQCREFGGTVSEGACESPDGVAGGDDDVPGDDGGLCTVTRPGSSPGGRGALPFALALLALRLTRLRREPRRSPPPPRALPRP